MRIPTSLKFYGQQFFAKLAACLTIAHALLAWPVLDVRVSETLSVSQLAIGPAAPGHKNALDLALDLASNPSRFHLHISLDIADQIQWNYTRASSTQNA